MILKTRVFDLYIGRYRNLSELAKAMDLDYASSPIFAALEQAIEAGEPAPVLSAIKGVSLLFALNHAEALKEEGTISGEGNAGEEVFQKLLDHPEGVLLYRTDPTENWELLRPSAE